MTPASAAIEALSELGMGASKEEILARADQLVTYDSIMRDYEKSGRQFDWVAIKAMFLADAFARRTQVREEFGLLRKTEAYIIDPATGRRLYKSLEEMDRREIAAVRSIKADQEHASRRQKLALVELEMRIEAKEKSTHRKVTAEEILAQASWDEFLAELSVMTPAEVDDLYEAVVE